VLRRLDGIEHGARMIMTTPACLSAVAERRTVPAIGGAGSLLRVMRGDDFLVYHNREAGRQSCFAWSMIGRWRDDGDGSS